MAELKSEQTSNCRSIWDNDFYNEPPALSWTFKIIFDDFITYKLNENDWLVSKNDMNLLNKAAVSISVGERKIEQTDLYYGGLGFKHLTRVENTGTFTIKFNENSRYAVTDVLERIYHIYGNDKLYFRPSGGDNKGVPYMYNTKPSTGELSQGDTPESMLNCNLRQNIISVKIFDPYRMTLNDNVEQIEGQINSISDPEAYKQYKFYNCKLVGLESIEYNYESTDTITRNAVFVYDWMEYNPIYNNSDRSVVNVNG